MKRMFLLCIAALMIPVLVAPIGCRQNTPEVVEVIAIFKAQPGYPPPPGGWGVPRSGEEIDPHPDRVQQVFDPGDKMYLGLRISDKIKEEVAFSGFTYFNRETGEETETGSPEDLSGVWEPGQLGLLAFNNPWPVPDEPGEYQVRIYLDNNIVASGVFKVSNQ